MKKLLFVSSFLILSAGNVFAADLAREAIEPASPSYIPYSWTGFYIGVQAGYGRGASDTKLFAQGFDIYGRASNDPGGMFGGLHAGYNYQLGGNFVVGVEGDISLSAIKSSRNQFISTGSIAPAGVPLPLVNDFRQEWFGSARLRAGYAFERFLPYITGGLAFGDIKAMINGIGANVVTGTASDSRIGWTIGAGLEYAITQNVLARVEYRYSDYGTASLPATDSRRASGRIPTDLKANDVRIGISYKF